MSAPFTIGIGLAVYGGIKYLIANQKPANEVRQQQKIGLRFVAAGVAAIAFNVGRTAIASQFSKNPVSPPAVDEGASTIEGVSSCSITALRGILDSGGSDSITAKTFKVLEDTKELSCDNHLPWRNEFHFGRSCYIDGIDAKNLAKPAMWGIDPRKRPFVAIKYVCNETKEGAVAFFQRGPDSGYELKPGGHFKPEECPLGPLDPSTTAETEFLGNLTSLFKGTNVIFKEKNVISPNWNNRVYNLTLAK